MKDKKSLLEKRTLIKKKKPCFIRKDHHKKKKLGLSWRRARGLHNKQRLQKKGRLKLPKSGYRVPKEIRGFHKTGLFPMIVSNLKHLDLVTDDRGVLLSARIGDQKRKLIIEEIKKRGLVLLNLDADLTLTRIEDKIKRRKEERKKKTDRRKEKKKGIEEKVKKEEKSKEKKEELSDKEKKKLEKQEKDKLLTKKT